MSAGARLALSVALLAVVVVAGYFWWEGRPTGEPLDAQVRPAPTERAARRVVVHVTGAVARPGVYTLAVGERVADAIERAGGSTALADLSRVNLAARVRDEAQIRVPELVPTAAAPQGPAVTPRAQPGGPVNVNTASAADLERVPGIGAVTAQRIVEHRAANGPFLSVEQLRESKIMTAALFERARPYLEAP